MFTLYYTLYCHAEGVDYIATSGAFIFNDFSAGGFCLNVSIIDDQLVEVPEVFFVCASSDRAQDVQFTPTCVSVNVADNDGIMNMHLLYMQLCVYYCNLIYSQQLLNSSSLNHLTMSARTVE